MERARIFVDRLWGQLGGAAALTAELEIKGPEVILPSRFDVTGFAAASVGVATLAVSELEASRTRGPLRRAVVDTWESAAAFRSEAHFTPIGWERPAVWDPIAGDYRARDRFVRLHTNYASHRDAALAVLGVANERARVEEAVRAWDASALEAAVVERGGCAAVLYAPEEWLALEPGRAAANEPAVRLVAGDRDYREPLPADAKGAAPLAGLRVLDLTRVIAGPVCTRFLAAHGADVLRIDPPGFDEVPAVIPDVTYGKRCASLDLRRAEARATFAELLATTDVLVTGLRPGALAALGFDAATLRRHAPSLVVAELDAYGWEGPWRARRGFDSLVQMSTGIAWTGEGERPSPLPAQALDHGAGYILAAGVCRALASGKGAIVRASLVGAANALASTRSSTVSTVASDDAVVPADLLEEVTTAWGPARRVRCPGALDGLARPSWSIAAGPLGRIDLGDPATVRAELAARTLSARPR